VTAPPSMLTAFTVPFPGSVKKTLFPSTVMPSGALAVASINEETGAHCPAWHALPDGQANPHAPQLDGSAERTAHAVPQSVQPKGHWLAQAPEEQVRILF